MSKYKGKMPHEQLDEEDDCPDKNTKHTPSSDLVKAVSDAVLEKLGTPKNLVKVEAYNYKWGDRDNRWRVNVVVEKEVHTELGTCIPAWRRDDSFFLHFDKDTKKITYCNPPIERKY